MVTSTERNEYIKSNRRKKKNIQKSTLQKLYQNHILNDDYNWYDHPKHKNTDEDTKNQC